ncbi:MAG TPA: hypothetical protein VK194_01875 [Candidatus Deferrimicrobium sp.]|nr:hypothetical protein [Candidatus Deferrimicrobium sp.]
MKRLSSAILAMIAVLALAVPVLAADDALSHSGRVLMAFGGDLVVPAGEQADAVIVVTGHVDILGRVNTVVVIDGTAAVTGTTIESLVVVRGSATVTNTHVLADIRTLDARVTQTGVTIDGSVRGLEADLVALGWAFGIGALLIWIGIGLATLVAGLLVAGLAGRQLQATASIIRREPMRAIGGGLLGIFVPPILAVLLAATVIGIPLAVSILLFVWPAMAFVGYIVAAAWVGQWVLELTGSRHVERERPYLATTVGIVVLVVVGVIPLLTAIISFLGFGAVVVAGWRTVRGVSTPSVFRPTAAPLAR